MRKNFNYFPWTANLGYFRELIKKYDKQQVVSLYRNILQQVKRQNLLLPFITILTKNFPINKEELYHWENNMKDSYNVVGAIYLDITNQEMKKRLLERKGDNDKDEIINERISLFENETKPILPLLEEKNLLIRIDGMKTVDEVSQEIEKKLNIRGLISPTGPHLIFISGGPGTGKSTQSRRIAENFGYEWFSTESLLREYVNRKLEGYQTVSDKMKKGELIPSDFILKALYYAAMGKDIKKFLLDGYPISKENMDALEELAGRVFNIRGVLYFEVSNEEMKKRLMQRNEERDDDNENAIDKRIATFEKETKPFIPTLESKYLLIKIDGMKSEDEIFEEVSKQIKESGINDPINILYL